MDVRMPDGTIIKNVPEGTTKAELKRRLEKFEQSRAQNKLVAERAGGISNPVAWAMRGMGVSDEIAGAARAVGSYLKGEDASSAYKSARLGEKERVEKFRKENPVLSPIQEIGGGILTGGATSGPAMLGAALGKGAYSTGSPLIAAAAEGLGWGAAAGAASAEPGDRLKGAAVGGTVGAALPLVVGGAVKGGTAAYQRASDYIRGTVNPQKHALNLYGKALGDDLLTPNRAAVRRQNLGPLATLTDAGGENVIGLARGAAGTPGPAKHRIIQTFENRARGEGARLTRGVTKGLGPGNYVQAEDDFLAALSKNAEDVYTPAYQANREIHTSRNLANFLKQPEARIGIAEAAAIVRHKRLRGENVFLGPIDDELTEMARFAREIGKMKQPIPREGIAKNFSLETWDHIKQGLDTLLASDKYTNKFTGKLNRQGRQLAKTKDWLVGILDRGTGGPKGSLYAQARAQYGGDAEVIEALRAGSKINTKSPALIEKELSGFSDAAKEAYRNGAARYYIEDVIGKTSDTASIATKLNNTPSARAKMRALFPTETEYLDFFRQLVSEQRFAKVRNAISVGSRTAPMQKEIDSVKDAVGSAAAVIGSNSPFGHELVMSAIARKTAQRIIKNPDAVRTELARMLTTRDPVEIQEILAGLKVAERAGIDLGPMGRAAAAAFGQQAGNKTSEALFSP